MERKWPADLVPIPSALLFEQLENLARRCVGLGHGLHQLEGAAFDDCGGGVAVKRNRLCA